MVRWKAKIEKPKTKELRQISIFASKHLRLPGVIVLLLITFLLLTGTAFAASYTVQPGDTLYMIGQQYGISAWELQQANNLNSTWIYPGQTLWVPDRKVNTYVVQPGDTLYLIGQRYNVSSWEIQQLNNLKSTTIYPGQVLYVPVTGGGTTYTVQPGDTLFLIGQRYGISAQQIMRTNGLSSTVIYPGQVLRIEAGSESSRETGSENPGDLDMLARIVYGEARGEPYTGQVAVAAVVLNRVRDSRFPSTIAGVIYDVDAFTCVNDGQFYLTPSTTAYQAAREALRGSDPSGGALYFWNPAKTPAGQWVWTRTIITTIGNHVFAK